MIDHIENNESGSSVRSKLNAAIDIVNGGGFTTGDVKMTLKTAADDGWVMMNDGSIGDASSSATTRANADTEDLFTLLWNNVSDTYCPVSSGRGGSAAADFAAHKTLTLPKALGRAMAGAGSGSGLTARSLGETLGEENHQLSTAELAQHLHTISHTHGTPNHTHSIYGASNQGTGSYYGIADGAGLSNSQSTTNSGNAGSNTAHNNMQPSMFLNIMIKL
jgi:microcystin-dependent protein